MQQTTLMKNFPSNKLFDHFTIDLDDDKFDEDSGEITATITSATGVLTKASSAR